MELTERSGRKSVEVREAVVGRTRFSSVTVDAADVVAPGALVARLRTLADPDVVLEVVVPEPSTLTIGVLLIPMTLLRRSQRRTS